MMFLYFLDPHTLYHRHDDIKRRTPLNTYRIYGDEDSESYAWGGPLFGPRFLRKVKAKTPTAAIKKYLALSKRKRWGWRVADLTARKERVKK